MAYILLPEAKRKKRKRDQKVRELSHRASRANRDEKSIAGKRHSPH